MGLDIRYQVVKSLLFYLGCGARRPAAGHCRAGRNRTGGKRINPRQMRHRITKWEKKLKPLVHRLLEHLHLPRQPQLLAHNVNEIVTHANTSYETDFISIADEN